MKVFSASALFGVISLALVSLAPTLVQACERECQTNVSHAFADKYQTISSEYFTLLSRKIGDSLFYGISEKESTLSNTESTQVIKTFQDAIVRAQTAWNVALFRTVFDTIFKDEPKFKGDCNNPHRVKQPPLGIYWVMSDCHRMDYICGNPPSICHFMPMIKHRIVSKLTSQLYDHLDGDQSDLYVHYLGPALQTVLKDYPKLQRYTAMLHGNVNQIMETVRKLTTEFAKDGTTWQRNWDLEIKMLLLTFP